MLVDGETSTIEFKIKAPRPGELAERICGMGLPGYQWTVRLFAYMKDAFGYSGDVAHGTVDARLAYTREHAPACASTGVGYVRPATHP